MKDDIRDVMNDSAMSRFQWLAVAICVTLNMLDGFDVLVMAFTASHVAADWKLNATQIGFLLSAGLFGMAAGSLFVAPWADRFGRRAVILFCLVVISLGMLLSAAAQDAWQLAALRAVTGVGIGGMLASINVITAEYASAKWRSTAIALQATGYPIGATIGGTIAAVLLAAYGWRSVFVFGAIATAAMIPVVIWRLPESVDFLVAKRPAGALAKLNALMRRMKRPELAQLPPAPAAETQLAARGAFRGLFAPDVLRSTLLIWASFFLLMLSFYFVLSWTPRLLVAAGLSAQQGITGGVLLNLGGIVGGTTFGLLAARTSLRGLTAGCLAATALLVVAFGYFTSTLSIAFLVALGIGACIFGSMAGLYAYAPILYPASIRSTGMGWSIGIGRLGAILAPMIAGVLVDGGWGTSQVYYAFSLPLVGAMLTVLALRVRGGASSAPMPAAGVAAPH